MNLLLRECEAGLVVYVILERAAGNDLHPAAVGYD